MRKRPDAWSVRQTRGLNIMKRFSAVIAVVLYVSVSAYSQSLTQADHDRAMKYLESTKQGVLDATAGLSDAQWTFKPGPDRWSVAEVTEHIAAAEDMLRGLITDKVMTAPPRPDGEDVKAIDEMVLTMIPDPSTRPRLPSRSSPQIALVRPRDRSSISPRAAPRPR